jgi:hypothetical protein
MAFSHINLVDGWKQTLYTAFEDNNLRIDTYKNMIMRYEIDNCRNQSLFNAFIENDNICYRILTQVWEINMSNFNGMEVCFRNVFNDLNMIRKVIVNNQNIIAEQSMVQINFLVKIDEKLQKDFRTINARLTKVFDNDLTLLQIQITTQLGQKIEFINIGLQKVKREICNTLDTGLNRLIMDINNNHNNGIDNLFDNVRNLFLTNETKSKDEHELIMSLLDKRFGYLDEVVEGKFHNAEKCNDLKLLIIDNNIGIIYNEVVNVVKMV